MKTICNKIIHACLVDQSRYRSLFAIPWSSTWSSNQEYLRSGVYSSPITPAFIFLAMLYKLSLLIVYVAATTSLATPVPTWQAVDRAGIVPGLISGNTLNGNLVDNTVGGVPSNLGSLSNGSPLGSISGGSPLGPIGDGLINPIGIVPGIIV